MPSLLERFHALPTELRKQIQLDLCTRAFHLWLEYCRTRDSLIYVETVCGTQQMIDRLLPEDAIRCVVQHKDALKVRERYREPICALQDCDLELPDDVELAYYSIYNLFRKYVLGDPIDDWLIVNQSLSAHGKSADVSKILESVIARVCV